MVPVLSSSRVLTSPAASTARPDIASTLTRTRRSMPAMPMADSRAPIVVGIRQTSSATRTTTSCGRAGVRRPSGASVATAARKTSVRLASRIDRAISLGVLRREVPSTSAIILSRKVSPAAAVMRTTMRSDSTRVPPVTALRSPPASRMTGADSPVIADSSTDAMPSTMSPSPGMTWPASTTTWSPTFSWVAGTSDSRAVVGQQSRHGVGAGGAERGRLCLAAALGDRLGEVAEEDRQPEPGGDRDRERARVA